MIGWVYSWCGEEALEEREDLGMRPIPWPDDFFDQASLFVDNKTFGNACGAVQLFDLTFRIE